MHWTQTVYQSSLFRNFKHEEFKQTLPRLHGVVRTVNQGAILLDEGELVNWGGIVIKGLIASIKTQFDGSISILDFIFPSKIFALDMSLTTSKISALSLQCLEDSVVYIFPFHGMDTLNWMEACQKEKMLSNILIYLANENVRKQHKIEITSQHSLRGRILTYLHFMCSKHGSNSFVIPYTREQLANYLCVNRSALSHELSRMRSEGVIYFKKNGFTLLEKKLADYSLQ